MIKNAILVLALAVTSTTAALAQPAGQIYRLGVLATSQPAATWRSAPQLRAFLDGLQQFGYVEGQNLAIEYRSGEDMLERLPELAKELLALKVDVLWVPTCDHYYSDCRRSVFGRHGSRGHRPESCASRR